MLATELYMCTYTQDASPSQHSSRRRQPQSTRRQHRPSPVHTAASCPSLIQRGNSRGHWMQTCMHQVQRKAGGWILPKRLTLWKFKMISDRVFRSFTLSELRPPSTSKSFHQVQQHQHNRLLESQLSHNASIPCTMSLLQSILTNARFPGWNHAQLREITQENIQHAPSLVDWA